MQSHKRCLYSQSDIDSNNNLRGGGVIALNVVSITRIIIYLDMHVKNRPAMTHIK